MKAIVSKKQNRFSAILLEKCPNCSNGKVFEKNSGAFKMPVMKHHCEQCNYEFNREPGYFLGAMYVSYGIAVFFGILTFLLMHFVFPALPLIYTPLAIVGVILGIAKWNYRISRIIYLHIFPW